MEQEAAEVAEFGNGTNSAASALSWCVMPSLMELVC